MHTIEVKITIRCDDQLGTPIVKEMAERFAAHMEMMSWSPSRRTVEGVDREKAIAMHGDECKGKIELDFGRNVIEWQAYVDGKVATNDPHA